MPRRPQPCELCQSTKTHVKGAWLYCFECLHRTPHCTHHAWTPWRRVDDPAKDEWARTCSRCHVIEEATTPVAMTLSEAVRKQVTAETIAKAKAAGAVVTSTAGLGEALAKATGGFAAVAAAASQFGVAAQEAAAAFEQVGKAMTVEAPKPRPTPTVHVTSSGQAIPVAQMESSHLVSLIRYWRRRWQMENPALSAVQCDARSAQKVITMAAVLQEARNRGLMNAGGELVSGSFAVPPPTAPVQTPVVVAPPTPPPWATKPETKARQPPVRKGPEAETPAPIERRRVISFDEEE
jgi:hypothetical protein